MALVGALGGPWGLALTAAGVGIVTLTTQLRRYNKETEEAIKNANNLANDIKNLRDRYVELANKTEKTNAEEEEFKQVTYEITQLLPQTVTGFDSVGEAITNVATVTEVATGKIRELKDEYANFIQVQAIAGGAALPGLERQLEALEEKYTSFSKALIEEDVGFLRGALMRYPESTAEAAFGAIYGTYASNEAVIKRATAMSEGVLTNLREHMGELRQEIQKYQSAIDAAEALKYDYKGHPARGRVPPGEKTSPLGFPDPTTTAESTAAVKNSPT
jgi:DNA repair exonuclease SbcCD ATPase subunit